MDQEDQHDPRAAVRHRGQRLPPEHLLGPAAPGHARNHKRPQADAAHVPSPAAPPDETAAIPVQTIARAPADRDCAREQGQGDSEGAKRSQGPEYRGRVLRTVAGNRDPFAARQRAEDDAPAAGVGSSARRRCRPRLPRLGHPAHSPQRRGARDRAIQQPQHPAGVQQRAAQRLRSEARPSSSHQSRVAGQHHRAVAELARLEPFPGDQRRFREPGGGRSRSSDSVPGEDAGGVRASRPPRDAGSRGQRADRLEAGLVGLRLRHPDGVRRALLLIEHARTDLVDRLVSRR